MRYTIIIIKKLITNYYYLDKIKISKLRKIIFMSNIVKTPPKKGKKYTGTQIFQKILEDRKMIKAHLSKGGTLEQLKEKGFRFATL